MGKREQKAQKTRAKILQVADQLIVEHGYEDVSVDDIVIHSGIAKGTFYNYFTSKEDLILQLSKLHFDQVIMPQTNWQQLPAAEIITHYLTAFMQVIVDSKVQLARQWIRYISHGDSRGDAHSKWMNDLSWLQNILQDLVAAHKITQQMPLAQITRLSMTQIYGIILSWTMSPNSFDPVQAVEEFCQTCLIPAIAEYLID